MVQPQSLIFVISALLMGSALCFGQPPVGRWMTIDDKTGEVESIIAIENVDGKLVARVDSLVNLVEPVPTCKKCRGEKRDQPILGMQIIWDMQEKGGEWSGGRALDPTNGKTYRCKFWIEDGTLRLRGYLGPFFRTNTWYRLETASSQ